MPTIPPPLAAIMVAFRSLFSRSVFQRATVLLVGALLSVRTRTVTAALRATGHHEAGFSAYHRVLGKAKWSCQEAARILLGVLVERFVPEGPVIVGMDDTTERRWQPQIIARGIYRDPVRSSRGFFVPPSSTGGSERFAVALAASRHPVGRVRLGTSLSDRALPERALLEAAQARLAQAHRLRSAGALAIGPLAPRAPDHRRSRLWLCRHRPAR